jgi:thiamine-monophosphate kinase
MTTPPRSTEFELIARHFAPLASSAPEAGNLLDDAALLRVAAGQDCVVSTDTIVEGVHFLAGEDPEVIAARLLAVGFSDIAAMGAAPTVYTVSLALSQALQGDALEAWLSRFAAGLREAQEALGAVLIGGDTVVAPGPVVLTLTAFGSVDAGMALRRSGARPGDDIWVSGTIGDAALGLAVMLRMLSVEEPEARALLTERYRRPTARIALGRAIAGLAHAAADVSDGLIADLGHICTASSVDAVVHAPAVPLSAPAAAIVAADSARLRDVLSGGDDYELVFTAPAAAAADIRDRAARLRVPVTIVGRIENGEQDANAHDVRVLDSQGKRMRLIRTGYRHV